MLDLASIGQLVRQLSFVYAVFMACDSTYKKNIHAQIFFCSMAIVIQLQLIFVGLR